MASAKGNAKGYSLSVSFCHVSKVALSILSI